MLNGGPPIEEGRWWSIQLWWAHLHSFIRQAPLAGSDKPHPSTSSLFGNSAP
jgi:hypothetical protein